jgi:hypothetical protein
VNTQQIKQLQAAASLKSLAGQCGTYAVARMMQKQGYSLYMALHILTQIK